MRRIEELPFEEVSSAWRQLAKFRKRRETRSVLDDSALFRALLEGKTLKVSLDLENLEEAEREHHQFKPLYNLFAARGYKLRVETWSDPTFHGLIVWLENRNVPRLRSHE